MHTVSSHAMYGYSQWGGAVISRNSWPDPTAGECGEGAYLGRVAEALVVVQLEVDKLQLAQSPAHMVQYSQLIDLLLVRVIGNRLR